MKSKTRFWDRIANKYAATPIKDEASYQHKLKMTQEYLKPEMEVLEIGCGTGTTALKHGPFVRRILATDFSEKMVEIAQEKANKSGVDNVEFRCEAIESISDHNEQYDVIMAHSILHLLEDFEGSLLKLYDRLKPGGYLVSSTACINDMMSFFRYIAPIGYRLRLIPYVNCFGTDDLTEAIKQQGFSIRYQWQANAKAALFLIAQKSE